MAQGTKTSSDIGASDRYQIQKSPFAQNASYEADAIQPPSAPEGRSDIGVEGISLGAGQKDAGILPLKIRLPKAGDVYRFNRLMTAEDALTLDATFVRLPTNWIALAGIGLLLVGGAGVMTLRIRRS